jgi:hypothetical protein
MSKNYLPQRLSKKYLLTASKTKFWDSVKRDNWIIKFSLFDETNILLVITSSITGQTIVRHYHDEDLACIFLNYVFDLDPSLKHRI